MTVYTVTWSQYAEGQLANLYMASSEPNDVTAAAHAIDGKLRTDPETKGVAWKPGLRILDVPPLSVLYTIQEADRMVRVISVKFIQPPSGALPRNGAPAGSQE